MIYLYLAWRNLILMRRRYSLMAVGIACAFAMVTVLTSLSEGVLRTLNAKSARYFAGEISVIDYRADRRRFDNATAFADELLNAGLPIQSASPRAMDYDSDFPLYFGGKKAAVRRIIGIDFERERRFFKSLPMVAGDIDDMLSEKGRHGIIVSSAVAEYLHTQIGDDITILSEIENPDGSAVQNTGNYILTGIFSEQNFFGYACYIHRSDFNALLNRDPDSATEIACYTKTGEDFIGAAKAVHKYLVGTGRDVMPLQTSRDEYDSDWDAFDFIVIPLQATLSNIEDLMHVFVVCVYFVLVVFLAVMVIGILNTYKVLVYERMREIGTMRAIGMQKNAVKALFMGEAFFLAVISAAAGFAMAQVALHFICNLDLSAVNLINFFTLNGRLSSCTTAKHFLQNLVLVIFAVQIAALQPTTKSCKVSPAVALRDE